MIKAKTVLVLGAGASLAYGFPLSFGLMRRIYNTLGKQKAIEILCDCDNNFNTELIRQFRNALPYARGSIDAFLEHRTNEHERNLGKAAIAMALLPLENKRNLWDTWLVDSVSRANESKNWYSLLADFLISGVSFEKFQDNELSVITFNYDRSLEQYLYDSLTREYRGHKDEEYLEKMNSIPIVHVYGSLGFLPWQNKVGVVGYDSRNVEQKDTIITAYSNIDIMHRTEGQKEHPKKATKLLEDAERICILGFGFDEFNLNQLKLDKLDYKNNAIQVYATTLNLRVDKLSVLKNLIIHCSAANRRVKVFEDTTIYDFLHNRFNINS